MANDKGYPFKWDVYPGNTAEVSTLIKNIDICRERFKLRNITFVFDRGIVSGDNLEYIDERGLKYISGLDKNQIQNIKGIDISLFNDLSTDTDNVRGHLSKQGFTHYDESLYYKDLGVISKQRYILGFNPKLFEEEKICRREKIASFGNFIIKKNKELIEATHSRNYETTKESITNELKRLKIKKYFQSPILQEIEIKRTRKDSKKQPIKTFQITIEKKEDKIIEAETLDGLCVFVSNHTELSGLHFLSGEKIISAYRDKTKIEDAFKHIKSFLKIRPFYVNTEKHVRAVYSICVLAYFLNKDLAERRKKVEGIDYLNSKNLYESFRGCQYVTLKDKSSGAKRERIVELTHQQEDLLKKLNIKIPKYSM